MKNLREKSSKTAYSIVEGRKEKMEAEIKIINQSPFDRTLILGELYRQALIEIGYSPDTHVYDLNKDLIEHKSHLMSARYVLDVIRFYESLNEFDRAIYCCQVLEYGRHYNFWWMLYGDKFKFVRCYNYVINKTNKYFS
jgi:hypothetical protein